MYSVYVKPNNNFQILDNVKSLQVIPKMYLRFVKVNFSADLNSYIDKTYLFLIFFIYKV